LLLENLPLITEHPSEKSKERWIPSGYRSLVALGVDRSEVLDPLRDYCFEHLDRLSIPSICHLVHGFGHLSMPPKDDFATVEGELMKRMNSISFDQAAHILNSFGSATEGSAEFYAVLQEKCEREFREANESGKFLRESSVSIAVRTLTVCNQLTASLRQEIYKYLEARLEKFHEIRTSVVLTWALSLDPEVDQVVLKNCLKFVLNHEMRYFNNHDIGQLSQIFMAIGIQYPHLLDDEMRSLSASALKTMKDRLKHSLVKSSFQWDVENVLKAMGVKFQTEQSVKIYPVDILIEPNHVIEIDGPHHRIHGKLLAPNAQKSRHLEKLGYKVHHFSSDSWNANLSAEKKTELVSELLTSAGIVY